MDFIFRWFKDGLFAALWENFEPWVVITVMALIAGVGMMFFGISGIRTEKESLRWPAAPGTITKSEVLGGTEFSARVEYTYTVNNAAYNNSVVAFSGDRSTKDMAAAQRLAGSFPQGAAVQVYYDPDSPGISCLIPGPGNSRFDELVTLAGLILVCVCVFVVFTKAKRSQYSLG